MPGAEGGENYKAEDVLRVLIATDLHVGYKERDAVRGVDSFRTLEEVLKIAKEQKVDFILCGGDLFHENKPSRETTYRVIQLLRQYCLNDRPVSMEFLSDPSINFPDQSKFAHVNYEDDNLNVGMPVFSIHGNHDDVAGSNLTALDVLHECGLLNLFGKVNDIENFEVAPVLLRKGRSHLALYGIGAQRDDRLARAFRDNNLRLLRPREDSEKWFNLLLLHQNRPKRSDSRSTAACVPEAFLPTFVDLVIWGHEHESLIEPIYRQNDGMDSDGNGMYIMQPGSTIATSLSQEEAGVKKVAVLSLRPNRHFALKPIIELKTVRQFYFDEVILEEKKDLKLPRPNMQRRKAEDDERYIEKVVSEMIERAKRERLPEQPQLPLIRVRVVYSGPWANIEQFNVHRFGQSFVGRVANPKDIVIFKRKQERAERTGPVDQEAMGEAARQNAQQLQQTVEGIVQNYFKDVKVEDRKLSVLADYVLNEALDEYVTRFEDTAMEGAVNHQLGMVQEEIERRIKPVDHKGDMNIEESIADEEAQIVQQIHNIQTFRRSQNGSANGTS